MAGIQLLGGAEGEVGAGDLHHVRAVLGQRAGAGGAGQHPGQVEDPHSRQGSGTLGQGFGRAVADLVDLQQGQGGDGGGLGVLCPLIHGADHPPGAVGGDDGFL